MSYILSTTMECDITKKIILKLIERMDIKAGTKFGMGCSKSLAYIVYDLVISPK